MRPQALTGPRANAAVIILFVYNGLVLGMYAAVIPILRDKLALSPVAMATLFVLTGAAAVGAMQVSGRLSDRFGARRVFLVLFWGLVVAAIGYALVPTYVLLLVTGVFLGLGNGGCDVAMNALAVQVERHRLDNGQSAIMSFFHGMWAVGFLGGSFGVAMVGTLARLGPNLTLLVCAFTVAGIGVAGWIAVAAISPDTTPAPHATGEPKPPIPRAAYLMGIMAVAFGLGEGTATDWSGTHVRTVAGVDPTTAAWAVTAMTACMVLVRLLGDRLIGVAGRLNIVRLGSAVAAIGYLTTAFVTPFPALLVGWALVGLGMGVIAPQVYASAGHLAGGRGLAVVATFGYATYLAGPAAIGTLAHAVGLHRAMALPGVLLIILIFLAGIALRERAR